MPSNKRSMGDDDEARSWDVIKADDKEPDDPEEAEDEFMDWADEMDARDEGAVRSDDRSSLLAAIAGTGVDITQPQGVEDLPLMERADSYLVGFARARGV